MALRIITAEGEEVLWRSLQSDKVEGVMGAQEAQEFWVFLEDVTLYLDTVLKVEPHSQKLLGRILKPPSW